MTIYAGVGLSLTTLEQSGGTVTLNGAVTTVNKYAGTLTLLNSAAITTFNHFSGHAYHRSHDLRWAGWLGAASGCRILRVERHDVDAAGGVRDFGIRAATITNAVSCLTDSTDWLPVRRLGQIAPIPSHKDDGQCLSGHRYLPGIQHIISCAYCRGISRGSPR